MRVLIAAFVLALIAGPALAQKKSDAEKALDAATRKAEDAQYRSATSRIPTQEQVADPWGNMRSPAPSAEAAAKPAPSRSASGKSAPGKPMPLR